MDIKTMRIKKIYFDAILDGSKRIEYRAVKPYYGWLETIPTPFLLRLHYQKRTALTVIVEEVNRITRPRFVDEKFVPTRFVWALSLGQVIARH
jgi:hypothetical protein